MNNAEWREKNKEYDRESASGGEKLIQIPGP